MSLDYIGFKPHKPGRIHLYCPPCGRKLSNMPRDTHDPPTAVLAHVLCEKCSRGMKGDDVGFLDAKGKFVYWQPAEGEGGDAK